MYKKYSNFDFKQKCSNMINIMSLRYYGNRLFSIKVKWLLIKKKKNYFNFGLVFNAKSTTFPHLIIKHYQEKNQILILIWMIYKKRINSYLVTTLKPFVLLFYIYQRLFFALVELVEINFHYVYLIFVLTIILFLDLKYHLKYYLRLCMILSIYKYIYTVDDW